MKMNVNAKLIVWIQSFLSNRLQYGNLLTPNSLYGFRVSYPNRLQYVNFNGTLSDVIEMNTGAPQCCVHLTAEAYLNM